MENIDKTKSGFEVGSEGNTELFVQFTTLLSPVKLYRVIILVIMVSKNYNFRVGSLSGRSQSGRSYE